MELALEGSPYQKKAKDDDSLSFMGELSPPLLNNIEDFKKLEEELNNFAPKRGKLTPGKQHLISEDYSLSQQFFSFEKLDSPSSYEKSPSFRMSSARSFSKGRDDDCFSLNSSNKLRINPNKLKDVNTPSVDDLTGSKAGENSPSWKNRLHEFYEVLWSSAVRSLFANNKENNNPKANGSKSCSKLETKTGTSDKSGEIIGGARKPSSVTFKCLDKYEVISSEDEEKIGLKKKKPLTTAIVPGVSNKSKDIRKVPTPAKPLSFSAKKGKAPTPAFKIQSTSANHIVSHNNTNRSTLNETPFRDRLIYAGKTPISLKTPAKVIYQACQKLTTQITYNIKPISAVSLKK